MIRWLPLALLPLLAACEGSGGSPQTERFGRDLAYNLAASSACVDDATACARILESPDSLCLAVAINRHDDYEGADLSQFVDICDRWEVIKAMPVYLAKPEIVRLAQDARRVK